MWYRITLSYACGGIRTHEGLVVEAAPIFRWMIGKYIGYVEGWVAKKRGTIEPLKGE